MPKRPKPSDRRIGVFLPEPAREAIAARAAADGLTLSAVVRQIVMRELRESEAAR